MSEKFKKGLNIYRAAGFAVELSPPENGVRKLRLKIQESLDGGGTPLALFSDDHKIGGLFSGVIPEISGAADIETFFDRLKNDKAVLSGVFAAFIYEKKTGLLNIWCDNLGIQAVYYTEDRSGVFRASVNLGWLLELLEHDGSIHREALLEHLGYGYNVNFGQSPYVGILRLSPASKLEIRDKISVLEYWTKPGSVPEVPLNNETASFLAERLRLSVKPIVKDAQPFMGLSAGKDCLCLASVYSENPKIRSGSFGADGCADRKQGAKVADKLGWTHLDNSVLKAEDFQEVADLISYYSGGLATTSAGDFLNFYRKRIPADNYFIIGEGGENTRAYFNYSGDSNPLENLVDRYMTSVEVLRGTLSGDLVKQLDNYPGEQVEKLKEQMTGSDERSLMIGFYRYKRMGGNFALRNAILSPFRTKVSPFLDVLFMEKAFRLNPEFMQNDEIHRAIIEETNETLLPFFDTPEKEGPSMQNWEERFRSGGFGNVVYEMLEENLKYSEDVFDREKVLKLCLEMQEQPGRGIYFLFRIISFAGMRAILKKKPTDLSAIGVNRIINMTTEQ